LAALLLVCQAPYVAANVAEGGGGSCTGVTESDGTQMLQQAYDDGLYTCSGGTYVPEALIVGGVTDTGATPSCSSTTAGMLYYTGGTIEYCNGTSFTSFSSGESTTDVDIELAAGSAAAPSLTFTSDTNTGIYQASSGSYTINFASAGAEIAAFDSTGDFNLTNAGATSSGAYQINGATILKFPDQDTTSIAVGKNALAIQSATSLYNTAIGAYALVDITTGSDNTAIGYVTLETTTGSNNTAVGLEALYRNTTGTDNTAVGELALTDNTTGSNNTAFGMWASQSATTATHNIAVGFKAMEGTSANPLMATSAGNIAIGYSALEAITGGATSNVAIGYSALTSSTVNSTAPNTAIGMEAMQWATTATNNTAIGFVAMQGTSAHPMTGAGYNVAIGDSALNAITTGADDNTAIGYKALYSNTSGSNNTALGHEALYDNTSGGANVAIGYSALNQNTTGGGSTAIGDDVLFYATGSPNTVMGSTAGFYITSGSDNIAIGFVAMLGTSANPLTGNYNTAVGDSALTAITTAAADNTALGYKAGTAVTGGTDNTLVGWEAGDAVTGNSNIIIGEAHSVTSGGSNIVIGNASSQITATSSSQFDIGDTILVEGDHNLATHGSGTVPIIASGCGSTASAIAGNNNAMVAPWGGTSGSTCTIDFNGTWGSIPVCTANSSVSGVSVAMTSLSTTALGITLSAAETSGSVYIICLGYK
jgi:hypothetical protein